MDATPAATATGPTPPGVLVLAGTPIGDVLDAPAGLARAIAGAHIVAAEDTRRLRRLCDALGVVPTGRVVSYHEQNELTRTGELVEQLRAGQRIVLVTDAGMPGVSDPGYRLVSAAIEAGVRVTALPGPSAVLTALVLSGLPVDRFCFEGFLPRRPGERARRLRELAAEPRTLVLFEAPHRLAASLRAMAEAFGAERPGAVCRELTKTYEEVRRGSLAELADWADAGVRGEVTVVVGGAAPGTVRAATPGELASRVAEREAAGESRREALLAVAREHALPKRTVFDAVVAAKNVATGNGGAASDADS